MFTDPLPEAENRLHEAGQAVATTTTEAPANLSATRFQTALRKLGACAPARTWAKGKDYATAWQECQNPDWLLWLLAETSNLSPRTNELLACRFAREVVHLNTDPRVLACLETRARWARGEASDSERASARAAAWAAAQDSARASAWAAAWAARAAAENSARASARASAQAWAAQASAQASARAKQGEIIREMLSQPTL